MENLKSEYEDVINSSEELVDTEDVLPGDANFDKSIEKEINAYEDILKDEGIGGLRRALCENSNKWKNIGLHIAVTGSSGAGKSSFINAIRGVCADDEGGAEVGVTETNTELTPFTHPNNPNFIVWDIPGVGTPKFPRDNYLECVKFGRYDFFMILSNSRFTEEDYWLANEIQKLGKHFYFVRTNIDLDIHSNARSRPKSHAHRQVIDAVTRECQKNLVIAGFDKPDGFLIENFDQQLYDFGKLQLQLVEDSDSQKMKAMTLSFSVLTREILLMKKKYLEERIDDKAMEIACIEDDYEQQSAIFEAEMSFYREQFSPVDEHELGKYKDFCCLSDENLKQFQDFFFEMSDTTLRKLIKIVYSLFERPGRNERQLFKKWGWMKTKWSHPLLKFSCLALHQNLEEIYKTACKVYNWDGHNGLVK